MVPGNRCFPLSSRVVFLAATSQRLSLQAGFDLWGEPCLLDAASIVARLISTAKGRRQLSPVPGVGNMTCGRQQETIFEVNIAGKRIRFG